MNTGDCGGEKRKLFSEKMEKIRRNRNRKLFLEASFFSRNFFSRENLFYVFLLWIFSLPGIGTLIWGANLQVDRRTSFTTCTRR